ncbi:DMT family transporter [Nitratiruptor sp. YY09-18]|uniref:DMT family transporter n=1 Tax=Nitratiruptor sp. YY09-18 TaxID=2724901 RepID=UPI001F3E54B0|nr:DMT family transporter [Nitratiruptor sp. YY09-18]
MSLDKGVAYMLLASLLFAGMGVFAKLLSASMPSLEVVFFRNIFGVFLVGASLLHKPLQGDGGKPLLLFFRGFVGFLALLMFFYDIAHIPLGEAMTYSKTSPIWTAIFAAVFLHEVLSKRQWSAIILGFIGIVLITDPFGTPFDKYDILGILSGMGAALAYTSVRELKRYYDTRAIVLSFMGVGTLGPLLLMLLAPYVKIEELDFMFAKFVMPHGFMWAQIVAMGLLATLAQIYMTKAYGVTKAGIVGAVSYSNIAFSLLFGLLFLGDPFPDIIKFLGIILIVISGIMVAKR